MNDAQALPETAPTKTEHFDVLIVGAGISGVGGAYHLTKQCPGTQLRRPGGAGELRRHLAHPPLSRASAPTATSTPSAIASSPGPARRSPPPTRSCSYMGEVIDENDLARHIRYRHQIASASWSSSGQPLDHRGDADRHRRDGRASPPTSSGCARATTATPRATRPSGTAWSDFKGRIVHPQTWPEDLDYKRQEGRRHRLRRHRGDARSRPSPTTARHVTMLQRSPTYFIPGAQRQRPRRHAARARDRRDLDPRDRAPQDPARPGRLHPPRVRASRRS